MFGVSTLTCTSTVEQANFLVYRIILLYRVW